MVVYDKKILENVKKMLDDPNGRELLDPILAGIDDQIADLKKKGATDAEIMVLANMIIDMEKDKLNFPKEMVMEFLIDLLQKDKLK